MAYSPDFVVVDGSELSAEGGAIVQQDDWLAANYAQVAHFEASDAGLSGGSILIFQRTTPAQAVTGSLIGFTAFAYLAKVTTPVKVSTYAFVNPMVAVFLGWLLAGERLSARTLMASLAIVAAVVVIILSRAARSTMRAKQTKEEIPVITDEIPAV
jgi:hypothetical protein